MALDALKNATPRRRICGEAVRDRAAPHVVFDTGSGAAG